MFKSHNTAEKRILILFLFVCLLISSLPTSAQEMESPEGIGFQAVMGIDLGVSHLELDPGETHTFQVSFEPERPTLRLLNWYTTDDSVVAVDAEEKTITALKPGNARVFVESFDGGAYTTVDVTVNGKASKSAGELSSGSSLLGMSAASRRKISSGLMNRYLSFIETSDFTEEGFQNVMQRIFLVVADVVPGSEQAESDLALSLGMEESTPLFNLNAVTLSGTLEQILTFASDNDNLVDIFGEGPKFIIDPLENETADLNEGQSVGLQGNTENLTSVSTAHKAGYYGNGATIAVIDTGLDSNHEQYKGRVIGERCFSQPSGRYGSTSYYLRNVCGSSTKAAASNAITKGNFAHGSHVTGIAAGKDGIAQKAKIVAVQAFTEIYWKCEDDSDVYYYACDNYNSTGYCCDNGLFSPDEYKAYDYLLGLANNGTKIQAVNMSYGGGTKYTSTCDSANTTTTNYLKKLVNAGIIPVVATGNSSWNDGISSPACISHAYKVGALIDYEDPYIAYFSNHSTLVDILAPGCRIYSASYPGTSAYTQMSGTSMATPMVTGAMAIMKQAYPGKTVAEYKSLLKEITDVTANKKAYYINWPDPVEYTFSYSKPVLNFKNIGKSGGSWDLDIPDTNVEGYLNEVRIKVNYDADITGFGISAMDLNGNSISGLNFTVEVDKTGTYFILHLVGSNLKNEVIYKLNIYAYKMINGSKVKSNILTKYGMPSKMVRGVTAVPGNGRVTLNSETLAGTTGTRYTVRDGENSTTVANKMLNTTSKVWTLTGLENGHRYYVTARAYNIYNNKYVYGALLYKTYFIPLAAPSKATVKFTNSSTATVTIPSDSAAEGIRVLYRTVGGALKNGCEAKGTKCTIKGISKSGAFEFYTMKYKTSPSGHKHYSSGVLTVYNTTASGLAAPKNPVALVYGETYRFTITKDSAAKGISVLYREGTSDFKLACEKASNMCEVDLTKTGKYTFYVMQYKLNSAGKKVYSPGIIVKNRFSPKSPDEAEFYVDDAEIDAIDPTELYDALEDYSTEADELMEEAYNVMGYDPMDDSEIEFEEVSAEESLMDLAELEGMDLETDDFEDLEFVEVEVEQEELEDEELEDLIGKFIEEDVVEITSAKTSVSSRDSMEFFLLDGEETSTSVVPSFGSK